MQNALHEDEIIAQYERDFEPVVEKIGQPGRLLAALEGFHGHGASDESSGDVETFYHFYRVHRWIVTTDSQGFNEIETYDTEAEAHRAFEGHDNEYSRVVGAIEADDPGAWRP